MIYIWHILDIWHFWQKGYIGQWILDIGHVGHIVKIENIVDIGLLETWKYLRLELLDIGHIAHEIFLTLDKFDIEHIGNSIYC